MVMAKPFSMTAIQENFGNEAIKCEALQKFSKLTMLKRKLLVLREYFPYPSYRAIINFAKSVKLLNNKPRIRYIIYNLEKWPMCTFPRTLYWLEERFKTLMILN